MRRSFAILFVGLAMAAGCKPATQATGAGPRPSSNVLTRQEIEASAYARTNLYETLEKLRPAFLRPRTTSSRNQALPVLYIDGQRRESLEYLRSIPSGEVAEIRYLNVQDATTRYGFNVPAGVLDVKLGR
jgi:hypothetical protein